VKLVDGHRQCGIAASTRYRQKIKRSVFPEQRQHGVPIAAILKTRAKAYTRSLGAAAESPAG